MGGVVVVIGYILLIPSALGIMFSTFAFFLVLAESVGMHSSVGTFVGGFFIFLGLASLVAGLLGWLLIMKKEILQCSYCGAVVAAS